MLFRVSVDVGGTFTDLVALDDETGELINIKNSSTPQNPEEGVIEALTKFLKSYDPQNVKMVTHATTVATNALFGQTDLNLPETAFITTKGFKDIIEIGRQRRSEVYNLFFQRPPMLVKRRHRYQVEERISPDGKVLKPLNPQEVELILSQIEKEGIKSLAIGLLNSYANSQHETEILEKTKKRFPNLYVTASSLVSSGYREYERFSTAVLNATLMPIISSYVSSLEIKLKDLGIVNPLYVMQSNGGMASSETVVEIPATIVESGPASGVIAASWLGNLVNIQNIISFDMGGTTAKAGTIRNQKPEIVQEYEVAGKVHLGRLIKGSGYPVSFPFIDLAECSAGGGTIAWIDEGGALNVGPKSSGATPGPACYGRGGLDATVTDANLVLGRLNPHSLLDGNMDVHPEPAKFALKNIGDALGLNIEGVSSSIISIVNSIMSKILRIISIERGFDPRIFTLIAFGGAGPMHACALCEELQIKNIMIPGNPGMFSAVGLLAADLCHDYSHAIVKKETDIEHETIESLFKNMEKKGLKTLLDEGIKTQKIHFQRQLDMRYLGQSYELTIDVPRPFDEKSLKLGTTSFHKRHKEIYGYAEETETIEIINIRLRATGMIEKPYLREQKIENGDTEPKEFRPVYFENLNEWIETPIFERNELNPYFEKDGPAIIEQYDSTTVVYPDWRMSTDQFGIIHMRK